MRAKATAAVRRKTGDVSCRWLAKRRNIVRRHGYFQSRLSRANRPRLAGKTKAAQHVRAQPAILLAAMVA